MEFDNFMGTGGTLEWGLSSEALFTGEFTPPGKEKSWKMVMKQATRDRVMDGLLSDGTARISLKGTRALAGTTLPLTEATGYLFYGDQGLVGAVDVLNQGSVWIAKGPVRSSAERPVCGSFCPAAVSGSPGMIRIVFLRQLPPKKIKQDCMKRFTLPMGR